MKNLEKILIVIIVLLVSFLFIDKYLIDNDLTDLEKRLKIENEKLKESISAKRLENILLYKNLEKLEVEIKLQKDSIDLLEKSIVLKENEIIRIKTDFNRLRNNIDKIKKKIDNYIKEPKKLEDEELLESLKTKLSGVEKIFKDK
jgi:septal ring factor EnvC (AmiA/AmiB activator)